ncbi:MAG: sugar phosphate isomerase/epimerase [Thermomicrobiales bacterium]|nr:sugar phosphate isomerase/epimerase [Thermomicrobiales bacterium]
MKLGFLTAALPELTLGEIAAWAAEERFQMLEIACWPHQKVTRRYGGVTHIDVAELDKAGATEVRALLDGNGLDISSLAYYPNYLDPDAEVAGAAIDHLKQVIDAAVLLEVPIVGTFVGADQSKSARENMESFARVWPAIVAYAAEREIKIAIENCPMVWEQTWPGGQNVAYSPALWKQMFEIIPDEHFGLNMDPSHLIWQFIDEVRVIHDFADRIFHFHAKDMEIDREMLYQDGVLGCGFTWAIPRLPGLGQARWPEIMAALYRSGYDYVVSIEHEDRKFEGSEELVKRGFRLSRDVLEPWIK